MPIPIKAADQLREEMHSQLRKLSSNCRQLLAKKSSHFVWVDQPEIIRAAIEEVLQMCSGEG